MYISLKVMGNREEDDKALSGKFLLLYDSFSISFILWFGILFLVFCLIDF